MKKPILTASLLLFSLACFSQKKENKKPEKNVIICFDKVPDSNEVIMYFELPPGWGLEEMTENDKKLADSLFNANRIKDSIINSKKHKNVKNGRVRKP